MFNPIKALARKVVEYSTTRRATLGLYQWLFECSPHRLADILVRLQKRPDFDFDWTVRLLNGKTIVVPVSKDNPGSWEFAHAYHWHDVGLRNVERLIHGFFGDDGIFFDVGANMGVRSLLPLSEGRKCVLFEPNPRLRCFTERVLERNRLSPYEVHNICLSNVVGTQSFFLTESSYTSSLHRENAAAFGPVEEVAVPTTTLDAWCESHPELPHPSVIKIDVEGADYEVLVGAERVIKAAHPVILIELAWTPAERQRSFDLLADHGYSAFGILNTSRLKLVQLSRDSQSCYAASNNYVFVNDESLVEQLKRYCGTARHGHVS